MGSVRDRLEEVLAAVAAPDGVGPQTFIRVSADTARAAADAADARARLGVAIGPLDGMLVSVKDLFDVAGEPTTAGSAVLAETAKPAFADCPVVTRLRQAGAVIVGRTNLSEFAFHAMGTNPHYGTPGNRWDRARVPGGSSSGAAISVAEGWAAIGLGSDTAGSIRIPAALNGVVGFKPTQRRVPLEGVFPLSYTLDSAGPLTPDVATAQVADAVLAGKEFGPFDAPPVRGLRFAVVRGLPLEGLDATVGLAFERGLRALDEAGAVLCDIDLPLLADMADVQARAGFSPVEALHVHRDRIDRDRDRIDPIVVARIDRGKGVTAVEYIDMQRRRLRLCAGMDATIEAYDGVLMPTCAIVAPTIAEVAPGGDAFLTRTLALIRNTIIANFFDLCSVSLPLMTDGLPVGLMVTARHGHDARLLQVAAAIERVIA